MKYLSRVEVSPVAHDYVFVDKVVGEAVQLRRNPQWAWSITRQGKTRRGWAADAAEAYNQAVAAWNDLYTPRIVDVLPRVEDYGIVFHRKIRTADRTIEDKDVLEIVFQIMDPSDGREVDTITLPPSNYAGYPSITDVARTIHKAVTHLTAKLQEDGKTGE